MQREFRVDFAQSLTAQGCVIFLNIPFVKKITLSCVNQIQNGTAQKILWASVPGLLVSCMPWFYGLLVLPML
jgi:hypothetical protein